MTRLSHRVLAGGIILVLFVGLAWAFGLGAPGYGKLPRPFDSEDWKAADGWDDTRCNMVADLRHRIGLTGRTEAEVVALLGPPTSRDREVTTYHLCPSFMDIYVLRLWWTDGRVVRTRVHDT